VTSETDMRKELLARVEQVRDVLTRTAMESEEARFLVPEAVSALREAGLLRLKVAAELGGWEATPATQLLVIEALTEIDPGVGWNVMVNNNSTGFMSAYLPDTAIAEVFADGVPIAAGVAPPMGSARKVDGGYVFTGRWKTCSGVRQSSWLRLTGARDDGGAVFGVLPQVDATIHDTWHVFGLRGTGSFDVSLDGYFVPDHRCITEQVSYRGSAQYRLTGLAASSYEHTAIALGLGRRALRELTVFASRRGDSPRDKTLTDLGRCGTALDAIRALALETYAEIYRLACDDAADSAAGLARAGLAGQAVATHATEVALDCAETAYRHAGTTALYLPNPFERLLRDVHGATQHVAVQETNYRELGARMVADAGKEN
jgi:indole-3-acetate monooxygenase